MLRSQIEATDSKMGQSIQNFLTERDDSDKEPSVHMMANVEGAFGGL